MGSRLVPSFSPHSLQKRGMSRRSIMLKLMLPRNRVSLASDNVLQPVVLVG